MATDKDDEQSDLGKVEIRPPAGATVKKVGKRALFRCPECQEIEGKVTKIYTHAQFNYKTRHYTCKNGHHFATVEVSVFEFQKDRPQAEDESPQ